MQSQIVSRVLVGISILFGASVAILAILGYDHIGPYAAIGGVVVGALWAMKVLFKPLDRNDRQPPAA